LKAKFKLIDGSVLSSLRYSRNFFIGRAAYLLTTTVLFLLSIAPAALLRFYPRGKSVICIGERRHIQYDFVNYLKDAGLHATYLAVRQSDAHWDKSDLFLAPRPLGISVAFEQFYFLWRYVMPNRVVHSHCMMGISNYQWEFFLLKLANCRIVAHLRGCEARTRAVTIEKSPDVNICNKCDYEPNYLCMSKENIRRRWVARNIADVVLVTTPDMLDHFPEAYHLPFFLPRDIPTMLERTIQQDRTRDNALRVLLITNQPGIEDAEEIRAAIKVLIEQGLNIQFSEASKKARGELVEMLDNTDVLVGKLTMGYYANAQIEAILSGIPTIFWIRSDLSNEKTLGLPLKNSSIANIEGALKDTYENRDLLYEHSVQAFDAIQEIHDTDSIMRALIKHYRIDPGSLN